MRLANLFQGIDKSKSLLVHIRPHPVAAVAPALLGGLPLPVFAGQETALQRAIGNDAQRLSLAETHQLRFILAAMDQVVMRL